MPRRRRSVRGLQNISTADLHRELQRRQSAMRELVRQRDALNAELEALGSVFGGLAPVTRTKVARGRRGRGRRGGARGPRKGSLVDSLQRVLGGATMSVGDAAQAVKRAGHKSKSANFRVIVNQALLANRKLFRKVGRGMYTAK